MSNVLKLTVVESEGWCFNVANGCREELSGGAKWTGYEGKNKESCLQSCMQIPEALGCEFRKAGNGYDCKAFSTPVSNQSSDFLLYEFFDQSEFTCWSINRGKKYHKDDKYECPLAIIEDILSEVFNGCIICLFLHLLFTLYHR